MTEFWEPRTEADLKASLGQGLFTESHIFDAKKQPPPPTKNEDIAVDFASFAVDGGKILYGVHQPKSNGLSQLIPFKTDDLAERLDQIARGGLVDPPVRIRCVDIASNDSPGLGYLLVVIPRSPDAPHMVAGRYRYRSDRTNSIPSNAEVRRLIAERVASQRDIAALLIEEVERDPTGSALRTQGHMFIVGQPLVSSSDLLARALGTQNWQSWLNGDFRQRVASVTARRPVIPDLFESADHLSARMQGWAIRTYEMGIDRNIQPNGDRPASENELLDLEIRDDGGLRLFCGRASFVWGSSGPTIYSDLVVTLTRRFVRAAAAVSAKAQFQGEWGFGLALRGIGVAAVEPGLLGARGQRRVDAYDATATASYEQVESGPDQIVRQLLTRFFRGLGYLDQIPGLADDI